MTTGSVAPSFHGLRVLALESRRATELARLITTYGGQPLVAPALREVPLESNTEALGFADALIRGGFDVVIFLTGVGTRALVDVVEPTYSRDVFVAALSRTKVVARGPKPLAVLRELGVPVWIAVPEPNTWHQLLEAIDIRADERPLRGARVGVQEYGVSNTGLLDALRDRGAEVTRIPVYRWAMPEDLEPLRRAATAIAAGEVDVVVFTTSVQVVHLWQIVCEMHLEAEMRRGLGRTVIASIGPTTSEELRRHGLAADVEPSHPKIGFLVRELAERSAAVLSSKRTAG
jgi:uroporphyrinogen-III synthase